MAPLFEEIVFRGFFFSALEKVKGKVFGVVLVSVVFAGMHCGQYWGDWMAIAMIACVGLVLTLFRVWSGSAIAGIVMHYTYNCVVTVVPIILLLVTNPSFYQYNAEYAQLTSQQKEGLLLKSIATDAHHAPSFNDLAWLYASEDRNLPKALQLVEKALLLDSEAPAFLDTKAEVLYKMGRLDEAIDIEKNLVEKYSLHKTFKLHLEKFDKAKEKQAK